MNVDGIFPYIGFLPNTDLINGQVEQDSNGFIITDETMKTSIEGTPRTQVPGVFAAGDVRKTPLRQVITATSDGAVAAVYAGRYVESLANAPVA